MPITLACSNSIRRVFVAVILGASMSMLTACSSDSSDNDPADSTPVDESVDFTGTWIVSETSEESFGAWNNNVLQGELKFRKTSRQLVTITQQDNTAQIQLCGDDAITASVSAAGLAYDANTYMPTINNVTDHTPIVRPLVLASDADGTLRGTIDTGLIPVLSEPYPNSYRVTRDITLTRVSPDVNVAGIGSLTLDWSFLVNAGTATTERRDDTVSCFVETVRTKTDGNSAMFYGVDDRPVKSLMLDAGTVQVTFADSYQREVAADNGSAATQSSYVQRSVALKLKPVVSAIGFSQSLNDLSAEEESHFLEPSPMLLRQQYASGASSLAGTINVDSDGQFMHALFDLNW